jgi:hypothetical protein
MKTIASIITGCFLLVASMVSAQGKSGVHNNKNKNYVVTTKTHSSNGVIKANQHASATAQRHASSNSVLNRTVWTSKHKPHAKNP